MVLFGVPFLVPIVGTLYQNIAVDDSSQKNPKVMDMMDQTVGNYTCHRKTRRWPGILWYKVLDVARLIAYTNLCHI